MWNATVHKAGQLFYISGRVTTLRFAKETPNMQFPVKHVLACALLAVGATVAHAQTVIKFSHVVA